MVSPFSPTPTFWEGKRVFLTGHTGFKGGWLSLWLRRLGAQVCGYSLEPPSTPNLFSAAGIDSLVAHVHGDLLDQRRLAATVSDFKPDLAFHLAAQPLVRRSYDQPLYTFAANVLGTANFLDACRKSDGLRAVVVVTTDKCYENRDWPNPYRENDRLGGRDPYSASKACAELVAASYRDSFFTPEGGPWMATVRAGNVIGGGDWGADRLIPDAVRAFSRGEPLRLRRPTAVRPWQHVIDPLTGYLMTARALYERGASFARAFNFGPAPGQLVQVGDVADRFAAAWGETAKVLLESEPSTVHEAFLLQLDSSLARHELGWRPAAALQWTLERTSDWYRRYYSGLSPERLRAHMAQQIEEAGANVEAAG